MSSSDPKVSVLMLVRNQAPFIEQAVESALMQQTAFDVEIVIGEDCSSDGTREIVRRLASAHPDRIRPLYHAERLGLYENLQHTRAACRGEYFAALDGDDYWTDPSKLQRQIDALDARPDYVGCFHRARLRDERTGEEHDYAPEVIKDTYGFDDIIQFNVIPTCSVVYRNRYVRPFPEWVARLPMPDWPAHILFSCHGPLWYIDDAMAVYRRHEGGMWSRTTLEEKREAIKTMYRELAAHFGGRHDLLIELLIYRMDAIELFESIKTQWNDYETKVEQERRAHEERVQGLMDRQQQLAQELQTARVQVDEMERRLAELPGERTRRQTTGRTRAGEA